MEVSRGPALQAHHLLFFDSFFRLRYRSTTNCIRFFAKYKYPGTLVPGAEASLDREAFPPPSPAAANHVAPAHGRHPRTKSMGALPLDIRRLIRPFHCCLLWRRGELRRLLGAAKKPKQDCARAPQGKVFQTVAHDSGIGIASQTESKPGGNPLTMRQFYRKIASDLQSLAPLDFRSPRRHHTAPWTAARLSATTTANVISGLSYRALNSRERKLS